MNTQQQLQLEDAQKKLSIFRKHLDLLARCSGESKNVDANEVLSAVSELQTLVEWAAQQPELGAESAVLLVKLHELHKLRENLEKTPKEAEDHFTGEVKDTEEHIVPDKPDSSKDLEFISDIVTTDLCDNNGDNMLEEDLSCDKESLCDFSASTEDPNLANAESPESIEDANVDIIPNDDKTEEVAVSDENDYPRPVNDPRGRLNSDESQQENSGIQESFEEPQTKIPVSVPEITGTKSPSLFRSEVIIIETDEDNKVTECLSDSKNSNDPLDICMYAIRNLYESLRVKENELLKLSAMQNDQKHIEALQAVIIDFHKDITNLNSQLETTKKENTVLKEQVLELEEAENDARLEAQKLEQKLVFLQEKDSHSQAELSQLKQTIKKSTEIIAEKEASEKELRSQIKYMETLVQKYEDQIKVMEAKEIANFQKLLENKLANEDAAKQEKTVGCDKGTQTYPISQTKIDCNGEVQTDSDDVDRRSSISQSVQVPEEPTDIENNKGCVSMNSPIQSTSDAGITQSKEEPSLVSMECISQKELLNRLHKLIDEDASLQQQIHYVDQINLALWKKLQNLDNHIGECKRQNINETDPGIPETMMKRSRNAASETEACEPSGITTDQNIPSGNSSCLDQNEQYIQERLTKLEEINSSFEKELKTRDTICKEKEKKYGEWMETEQRLTDDLKRLSDERDSLTDQITNLKKEKEEIEKNVQQLEEELDTLKKNNQVEITKIRAEQELMTDPLNLKVNQLLAKEKEILKMLTNIKSQKTKNQDKSELERLKCRYIELQLELSHFREEIQKIEEQYRLWLDESTGKHLVEETQRISELERLHNENTRCDKMISNLEMKQQDLLNALEKQEKYLQHARENYKKNLEETEEEHRYVETELKTQLSQIEEGTVIATTALKEERKRVEKELQENVDDLRSKEEVYKTRIAELERDVIHLHEELHKMATESEPKQSDSQPEANTGEQAYSVASEVSLEKTITKDQNVPTESSVKTTDPKSILTSPQERTVEEPAPSEKDHVNHATREEDKVEEEYTEENVDELRAQVRELQCHLEMISNEATEMPPAPQPAKPIQPVKPCLGSQKLEDLDYAEVDDCLDAWRKSEQNASSKDVSSNFQGVYGEKHRYGYGQKSQNKKTVVQKPVEENDYDEVLPRPTNFHVVQQVGSDTLLVGWNYVNPSILDGFEVYLGNQVHERIYIPDRTKALISGLNLRKPIHLSICALSRYGQMSEPAVLDISLPHEINSKYFEDEDDAYRDFEDPTKRNQRPYSMEW